MIPVANSGGRVTSNTLMRSAIAVLFLAAVGMGQSPLAPIPKDDAIRIREFYRLSSQIQDKIWPGWSSIPAPLLLVTPQVEYLTHHPSAPEGFTELGDGYYARPRQFQTNLLATFPAFGPPSLIVIGEPANTASKTSTPWLITLMHEHFHQLQYAQPGYYEAVQKLGLSGDDKGGMWMLNYPFPYDKDEVMKSFASLRDSLLAALRESDEIRFREKAHEYIRERKRFLAQLSPNDRKYFSFQLWQEGIARYTQIKAAEAATRYAPTAEYAQLSDFESFALFAPKMRTETLDELSRIDLRRAKRTAVYSFGAAEGLLLDHFKPGWKNEYFKRLLSMDQFFDN